MSDPFLWRCMRCCGSYGYNILVRDIGKIALICQNCDFGTQPEDIEAWLREAARKAATFDHGESASDAT